MGRARAQLPCHVVWQGLEGVGVVLAEVLEDVSSLFGFIEMLVFISMLCEEVVKLTDESSDGRYELDESFRYQHHTVVHSVGGSVGYDTGNVVDDVVERVVVGLHLL